MTRPTDNSRRAGSVPGLITDAIARRSRVGAPNVSPIPEAPLSVFSGIASAFPSRHTPDGSPPPLRFNPIPPPNPDPNPNPSPPSSPSDQGNPPEEPHDEQPEPSYDAHGLANAIN